MPWFGCAKVNAFAVGHDRLPVTERAGTRLDDLNFVPACPELGSGSFGDQGLYLGFPIWNCLEPLQARNGAYCNRTPLLSAICPEDASKITGGG